jgi:hypothetical protein
MDLVRTVNPNDRRFSRNIEVSFASNPTAPFGFASQQCFGLMEGSQVPIHPLGHGLCLGQKVLHKCVWKFGEGFQ